MNGENSLLMGVAKICVTPAGPVRLAGYAFRNTPFDDVREDIFVRVHYFQCGGRKLILVYGDLIWWGDEFVSAMRRDLNDGLDIGTDELFFVASHNHCGPGTGNAFLPVLETADSGYVRSLRQQVDAAVREARDNLEPVSMRRHDGECDLNVYRRRRAGGATGMFPNYDVVPDRRLLALSFRRADGSLKAATVSYPCHANVSSGNSLHPDYPGIALRLLDEAHLECVSMFLQGCAGDLRPNSVLGRRFTPRGYDEAVLFASDFRDDCEAALATRGRELVADLSTVRVRTALPVESATCRDALRDMLKSDEIAHRQWAQRLLAKDENEEVFLEMGKVNLAVDLPVYVFSAEVSQGYAEFARRLHAGALSVSCVNGMIGYVPTASQIREGGYEPEGSTMYFALPGCFTPELESVVQDAMRRL